MDLVLISPPADDPREREVVRRLLGSGLLRYHVRKPGVERSRLAEWLGAFEPHERSRMVLHQHHELVDELGLGGRHWRDQPDSPLGTPPGRFRSRACHAPSALPALMTGFDAILAGPVFPSISKPGHAPAPEATPGAWIAARDAAAQPGLRRAALFALGGVGRANVRECRRLRFDGAALLGAVWSAADPVGEFKTLLALSLTP